MDNPEFTLVDTHCHLDFDRFNGERAAIVERALDAGVRSIIVPAVDLDNCADVLRLAERFDPVLAAIGIHPNSSTTWLSNSVAMLRDFAAHPKVVAIGEIGLDYYWDRSPVQVQQQAFAAQLELAADLDLPVIVHNRDAGHDVLTMLAASRLGKRERPGVLHSFSAGPDTANRAIEMGFFLGFTGPVTFKRADELRSVAANIPIERMLVETDAPFLAPEPFRGRRNEPAYVRRTAERIAELRGLSLAELAQITTDNAARLFGPRLAELL